MQITLSAQQSKALEMISHRGGYPSLENAIDTALILLADEVTQQDSMETPEHLEWIEQTRLKVEEAERNIDQGAVLEVDDVLAKLRNKVETARAASA